MIVIPTSMFFCDPRDHKHAVYVEGCAGCVRKQVALQTVRLNSLMFERDLVEATTKPLYCGCRCMNPYGECGCCDDGGW